MLFVLILAEAVLMSTLNIGNEVIDLECHYMYSLLCGVFGYECNVYSFFIKVKKNGSLRVCSAGLLKTLWKKEKLLVTSNFSVSHNVF